MNQHKHTHTHQKRQTTTKRTIQVNTYRRVEAKHKKNPLYHDDKHAKPTTSKDSLKNNNEQLILMILIF